MWQGPHTHTLIKLNKKPEISLLIIQIKVALRKRLWRRDFFCTSGCCVDGVGLTIITRCVVPFVDVRFDPGDKLAARSCRRLNFKKLKYLI